MKTMTLDDVYAIESGEGINEEQKYYLALQRAINSGAWGLQGSYGRSMMHAIEGGYCLLGEARARDYWGNAIPSRTDVKGGTKGSHDFVADSMGDEWAELMEGA